MKNLLNLENEIREAFSSAITSRHIVGTDERDIIVEYAIDILKLGAEDALERRYRQKDDGHFKG